MAKNIHLSLSDRIIIEAGLRERRSFSAIAAELGKDPTTISKEVRAHIKLNQAGGYNPCECSGNHVIYVKQSLYRVVPECSLIRYCRNIQCFHYLKKMPVIM